MARTIDSVKFSGGAGAILDSNRRGRVPTRAFGVLSLLVADSVMHTDEELASQAQTLALEELQALLAKVNGVSSLTADITSLGEELARALNGRMEPAGIHVEVRELILEEHRPSEVREGPPMCPRCLGLLSNGISCPRCT